MFFDLTGLDPSQSLRKIVDDATEYNGFDKNKTTISYDSNTKTATVHLEGNGICGSTEFIVTNTGAVQYYNIEQEKYITVGRLLSDDDRNENIYMNEESFYGAFGVTYSVNSEYYFVDASVWLGKVGLRELSSFGIKHTREIITIFFPEFAAEAFSNDMLNKIVDKAAEYVSDQIGDINIIAPGEYRRRMVAVAVYNEDTGKYYSFSSINYYDYNEYYNGVPTEPKYTHSIYNGEISFG